MRKQRSAGKKLLMVLGSLLTIVALSIALPFTGLLFTGDGQAVAQSAGASDDANPRSNFWRAVRDGNQGYSAVKGVDSGMLINNEGQNWRSLRNGPIFYWGWIALAVMAGAIVLFHLLSMITKSTRLENGRSGVKINRWDSFTRVLHWVTAISFIILAVTGLSLLYGRDVLIPLLGEGKEAKDAFAAWASIAKETHNYVGPVFGFSLTFLLLLLLRHNIPTGTDIKWLLKGGGLFSKNSHPDAGRMNAGEKIWFWLLVIFGMAVVISGFAMLFVLDLSRAGSANMMLIHAVSSLIIMAVALGHIYIGTAGTEGSLEAMTTGKVDVNWAEQHHNLWLQDLRERGKV